MQRLMDRARSRRENLEKKMAEQSVPRKRSVPLSESNSDNATTPPTSQDDGMYSKYIYMEGAFIVLGP